MQCDLLHGVIRKYTSDLFGCECSAFKCKRPLFPTYPVFLALCPLKPLNNNTWQEIHKSTENIWKQIISIQEYQGKNAVFSHCSCLTLQLSKLAFCYPP